MPFTLLHRIPSNCIDKKRIVIPPEKYKELLQKAKLLTNEEEQFANEQEKSEQKSTLVRIVFVNKHLKSVY